METNWQHQHLNDDTPPTLLSLPELLATSEPSSGTVAAHSQQTPRPSSLLHPTLSNIYDTRQAPYNVIFAANYKSEDMPSVQTSKPSPSLQALPRPRRFVSLHHPIQNPLESQEWSGERCPKCHEHWKPPLPPQPEWKIQPAKSPFDYAMAVDRLYAQKRKNAKDADESFAGWKEKHRNCPPKPVILNSWPASLLSGSAQGLDLPKAGFGVERSSSQRARSANVAPLRPLPSHHIEDPESDQESSGSLNRTNITTSTSLGGNSLAAQSEHKSKFPLNQEEFQEDDPSRCTGRDAHQVTEDSSQINLDRGPDFTLRLTPQEQQRQQHDQTTSSPSKFSCLHAELTPPLLQLPARALDVSVLNHLSSDSGYQSGLGTDTESVISEVSMGSSLGFSGDLIHDFVAFFGDTLIEKAGAQQWAQFAVAHISQTEIEKRLTGLLKSFAIDLVAERPGTTSLDHSTVHTGHDGHLFRVFLKGAIKLVRRYRPMIARYFLENSVSTPSDAVSLSDRLQGLGRHFSLAERVDLLVHQGARTADEDDEDNIVDEDIIAQLEPVQTMLVSSDAFRHLASELRRSFYRDDMYSMVAIQDVVSASTSSFDTTVWTTAFFSVKWDVMSFMRSQYDTIPPVASIVVLTGSVLYAQATTCGEYVQNNWPTSGPFLLRLLDETLAPNAKKKTWLDLEIETRLASMYMWITDDSISLMVGAVPKHIIVEIAQLFAWIGSALSNSPVGTDMAYGVPSIVRTPYVEGREAEVRFAITFEHEPLHTTEVSCWLSLFSGMTLVSGFPIPSRGEEMGLEISLELLAAIAGVSHLTKFDGGLVMKGFCNMIFPVQKTGKRVQWHAITSQDSETYLSYQDGLSRCKSRLSIDEVGFDDLKSIRTFLGWCSVYTSRLGSKAADYDNIDYSGEEEASTSVHLNGAQLGFQQWATATANFSIGAKQTKHYIGRDGPFSNILSPAERTPVLLYDTKEQRGYLISATDVMLHIVQHRHRLEPFEVNNERVLLETCIPTGSTAKDVLKRNSNVFLSDDGSYKFKHAIHNIWSILEDLRAKTVTKNQDAQGVALDGLFSEHLQGYEYKAIVQERGDYTLMEKKLSRSHGGWPQLVQDINALVLLADGFGDLILPSDEYKSQLCNLWQRVPSGCDHLATTCNVLTDLFDVAGSRASREHLTTTHLQWHQGESQLFELCEYTNACKCNRLQQIVSKSETVVRPNIGDVKTGAVIFGNRNSLLQDLTSSIWLRSTSRPPFYHHTNAVLVPVEAPHSIETVSMVNSSPPKPTATAVLPSPEIVTCTIRPAPDTPPKETPPEIIHRPVKKRLLLPDSGFTELDHDWQIHPLCESIPALKRKQAFRVGSAG